MFLFLKYYLRHKSVFFQVIISQTEKGLLTNCKKFSLGVAKLFGLWQGGARGRGVGG